MRQKAKMLEEGQRGQDGKRRKALTYQTGKQRRINAIIRVRLEDVVFLMIWHELEHSVNYLPLRKYDVDRRRRLLEVFQEQRKL